MICGVPKEIAPSPPFRPFFFFLSFLVVLDLLILWNWFCYIFIFHWTMNIPLLCVRTYMRFWKLALFYVTFKSFKSKIDAYRAKARFKLTLPVRPPSHPSPPISPPLHPDLFHLGSVIRHLTIFGNCLYLKQLSILKLWLKVYWEEIYLYLLFVIKTNISTHACWFHKLQI